MDLKDSVTGQESLAVGGSPSFLMWVGLIFMGIFIVGLLAKNVSTQKAIDNAIKMDNPDYQPAKYKLTKSIHKLSLDHPFGFSLVVVVTGLSLLATIGLLWTAVIVNILGLKFIVDSTRIKKEQEIEQFQETRLPFDTVNLNNEEISTLIKLQKSLENQLIDDHLEIHGEDE